MIERNAFIPGISMSKLMIMTSLVAILYIIISSHMAFGHSQYYKMGYNSALHNDTTSACNLLTSLNGSKWNDCHNGYDVGINVLYPPAKYYRLGYEAGSHNQTFDCYEPQITAIDGSQLNSCLAGNQAGQLVFDKQFSSYWKG
jgi:hypothetical protein